MLTALKELSQEENEKLDSQKGLVLVYSGPSGSGKGTILKKVRETQKNLVFSVSATTRAPREGEVHGEHYFFNTREAFEDMIQKDDLLEWVNYCDHFYGTPKSFVMNTLNQGKDIVVEVEVEGALNVKKSFPDCVSVFIMPPTFDSLKQRIVKRGSETDESMTKRLRQALYEISLVHHYDYIIVNDDLNAAINQLEAILIAEKAKLKRKKYMIEQIMKEGQKYEGIEAKTGIHD